MTGLHRSISVACVLAALVLVVLDAAMVNVALPALARSMHISAAEAVHVVTAYQLAIVIGLLPSAALGESLGYHRVHAAGAALFTVASALCVFAPSLAWLVIARFVQGLGGAAVMSLGVALLRHILPPERLGHAIGWNALAVALASASGPTVGAVVLSMADWRWLFAINVPLGALVLLAARLLPRVLATVSKPDPLSLSLYALAFAGLAASVHSLASSLVASFGLCLVAAACALVLVRRELLRVAPLIPFDLLRDGSFRVSVVASLFCFIGQSAAMVSLPFYLQGQLHQDALHTGLSITAWPVAVALVAPMAGRLVDRIAGAWLCVLGASLLTVGLASAALWPLYGDAHGLVPMVALCGAGFGLFQVANNRNMLLSAPSQRSAAAGGMQGTARLTGQTLGGLLMTLLFKMSSPALAPRMGLASAAGATLLAALVSTRRVGTVPDKSV